MKSETNFNPQLYWISNFPKISREILLTENVCYCVVSADRGHVVLFLQIGFVQTNVDAVLHSLHGLRTECSDSWSGLLICSEIKVNRGNIIKTPFKQNPENTHIIMDCSLSCYLFTLLIFYLICSEVYRDGVTIRPPRRKIRLKWGKSVQFGVSFGPNLTLRHITSRGKEINRDLIRLRWQY